ncbi:T9SS type B sorting domain-containing protein [Flavobacterium chuncheonense]|uniref:T9SS type B sorting domain-containing protein n=1 Tax=Flavobacterium chuncheonense TaxID=2026653 RepID=A0ABW5YKX3_9FLAO
MRSILTLLIVLISTNMLFSQEPNDCVDAVVVCGNGSFSSNATGIGDIQEVSGCSGFEHNSIWLKVNIVQSGTLGFDLIPDDPSIQVDYDFWVFGPNKDCSNLGSPIRCATTNPQQAGLTSNLTGMNGSTTLTTTGPGANGNGYVRWLTVTAGQYYYIAIDRPVGGGGFQINWIGSATTGTGAFPTPPVANQIPEYVTCSNTPDVGIFDLNSIRDDINPDLTNNTVSFYNTLADAIDGSNALPNIISNTTNPQTIYAKVVNNVSGCYSLTEVVLRVYQVPDATIAISNTDVCEGETVTVTFTGTPDVTVDYSVDGGAMQSAVLDATGNFTITTAVTATTTYTLHNVKRLASDNVTVICNQAKNESVTVNVQALPTVTILSNVTICENTSTTISFNGTPNAEVTYTVDGGSNQTITLDASGNASLTTPILTTTSVYALVSVASTGTLVCSQTQSGSATITVEPLPTATIAGDTVCSNASGTVTFTGTPNAVVTYSIDGGANQTVTLDASGNASVATPALTTDSVYTLVSVVIGTCNQALNSSAIVNVVGLPTASIATSTATICSNTSGIVDFTGTSNAVVTYTVDGGANQTITLDATGNASLTTPVLTSNSVYTLIKVELGTCDQTLTESVTISVLALPTVTISNDVTICENTSTTVTFTGTPNAEVTYTVDGGVNQTITLDASGNASLTTPILTSTSVYTLVSVATTSAPICSQTQTGSMTISVQTLPTATITGDTICSNSTGTVTFTGTPNGIVTYTVDGGANQTITLDASGNASLTTSVLTSDSIYTLVDITTTSAPICSQVLIDSATVSIVALPTANIATSTPTICANSTGIIEFSGTPDAFVTYTVNGGANQTITLDASGNASLTTPILNTNTVFTLVSVAFGNCSQNLSESVTIMIETLPVASITGDMICVNSSGTVTFNGTPNATVVYTVDGGANQSIVLDASGSASLTTPVLTANSTYTLVSVTSASTLSCSQNVSGSATVVVNPKPIVTFVDNFGGTICSNTPTSIELFSDVAGSTFSWTVVQAVNVSGATAGGGSSMITQSLALINTTISGQVEYSVTATANGCISDPISIVVNVVGRPIITATYTSTICDGETTDIAINSDTPGTTYTWDATITNIDSAIYNVSGDETNINQAVDLVNSMLVGTITMNVTPVSNGCLGDPIMFMITIRPIPVISDIVISETTICTGENVHVEISGDPTGTTYQWVAVLNGVSVVSGGTSGTTTGAIDVVVATTSDTNPGTIYFEVTPLNGICTGSMVASTTVTVNPLPGTPIPSPDVTICSGESPNIIISVTDPSIPGTEVEWFVYDVNGVAGANAGSGVAPLQIDEVLTTTGTTQGYVIYRVRAKLGDCLGGYTDYTVFVDPLPIPVLEDGAICVDSTDTVYQTYWLNAGDFGTGYEFSWYETTNPTTAIAVTSEPTLEISQAGTYYVVVENIATNCTGTSNTVTVVATIPATNISYTVTDAFNDNATVTIEIDEENGTYQYQMDDDAPQDSNEFTGVSSGSHIVTVVDTQGCTYLTIEVMIIDYPKYFTPNGDGINDTWNINGLNQANAKLYIFDRYGKLIKQISTLEESEGWNGTFNGQPLPATDYWFTLEYVEDNEPKVFKSHFTLKR